MLKILAVLAGGGLGSLSRYGLSRVINLWSGEGFPLGTMVVNWIGCLVIGILAALFNRFAPAVEWRLLLMTGFLGGFTTFSSFGLETVLLARSPEWKVALWYFLLTNAGGLALVVLGFWLAGGMVFKSN